MTIATPFTNKPEIIPLWLESFKALDISRKEINVVWLGIDLPPEVKEPLVNYYNEHENDFKSFIFQVKFQETITDFILNPENPLFHKKRQNVADTMNKINELTEGDVLLWEDDIIAPNNAFNKLKETFHKDDNIYGITGVQHYRIEDRKNDVLAWNWEVIYDGNMNYKIIPLQEREKGVEAIGAAASGFTLYRKEFLDTHKFRVQDNLSQDIMAGFDINFPAPFGGDKKMLIDWGLKLKHLGMVNGKVVEY